MPTSGEILVGFVFVLVGLASALCDRWQTQLKVQGVITRKPHIFDHMFVMWTLKQVLQMSLFFLSKFIEHFRNKNSQATRQPREQPLLALAADDGDEDPLDAAAADNAPLLNVDQPLLQAVDDADDANRENHQRRTAQQEAKQRPAHKQPNKLIYLPPAFFALAHMLLDYFGMKLTYSSSFIMLKGTITFFTALLSLAFLAQQLAYYVWVGVVVATVGFVVSGLSDYIHNPNSGYEKYGIAAGDLLILMAQIMFATKVIYEQKFITRYPRAPLEFLGCEGMYGLVFAVIFLLVFNFVDAVQYSILPNGRLEDMVDFAAQFSNSWQVILAVFGSLLSYALYIYLGMVLIRDHGALARIMTETLVWSLYWAVCLALNWEQFFIAQVPGLCVIVIGTLIYSHLLPIPFASRLERADRHNDNPGDEIDNVDHQQGWAPQEDEADNGVRDQQQWDPHGDERFNVDIRGHPADQVEASLLPGDHLEDAEQIRRRLVEPI